MLFEHRRCASLRMGHVGVVAAQPGVAVLLGRSCDLRDCGWELWGWVAAQPRVAVLLGGVAICEIAAGSCGGGWLHSQEWLCYKVKRSNRFRRRWRSSWTRASP